MIRQGRFDHSFFAVRFAVRFGATQPASLARTVARHMLAAALTCARGG